MKHNKFNNKLVHILCTFASLAILKQISTNLLTKHCIKMLSYNGFECWRQNNNAVYDAKIKGYRSNSVYKGVSDIMGYHKTNGKILAIEIKTGKDKLIIHQEFFINSIKKAGGYVAEIRSIDDLDLFLKNSKNG